jgi:hypothetical protein
MARLALLAVSAFAFAFAFAPDGAHALNYPRLHILAMGMHADRARVAPHELFHVSVRMRIAEGPDALQEPVLGVLDDCMLVSSERRRAHGPDGSTEFLETLTLEAGEAGIATLSPAYIDAVDSRTGRALRYSTNAVRVLIVASAPPLASATLDTLLGRIGRIVKFAILALGVFGGVIALVVFVLIPAIRLRSTRKPAPPPAEDVVAPPVPPLSREHQVKEAFHVFRRTRDAKDLVALREALFAYAGLAPGATLSDVLAAVDPQARPLRVALLAAERAAFGPQGERRSAGDDLVAALEAYFARSVAK